MGALAAIGVPHGLPLSLATGLAVSGGGALGRLLRTLAGLVVFVGLMARFGQRLVDPCHPCTADHPPIDACSRSMV